METDDLLRMTLLFCQEEQFIFKGANLNIFGPESDIHDRRQIREFVIGKPGMSIVCLARGGLQLQRTVKAINIFIFTI